MHRLSIVSFPQQADSLIKECTALPKYWILLKIVRPQQGIVLTRTMEKRGPYGYRVYKFNIRKPITRAFVLYHSQQEAPSGGGSKETMAFRPASRGSCLSEVERKGNRLYRICASRNRLGSCIACGFLATTKEKGMGRR